ncbi:MAG: hypothetical protein HQK54_04030 [Oligoflexales bacterium]|nr:hypothetical protein [Oligoflexales bacterium]
MKIAVCFKTTIDWSTLGEGDWVVHGGQKFPDTRFARALFGCYDESALELAIKISGEARHLSASSRLSALTVDGSPGDLFLRHLLALPYDRAIRISCDDSQDLRFNPTATSLLISRYVEKMGGDELVLLGKQGGIGENGQTGYLVAERLGWPCVRDVMNVTLDGAGRLKVTSMVDGGTLIQSISLPVVLIVGNTPDHAYLRVPTLKEKLAGSKKAILRVSLADLDLDNNALTESDRLLLELKRQKTGRTLKMIDGRTPAEKAKYLFEHFLKGSGK